VRVVRQEAVVDEEVPVDGRARIAALEVARAVVHDVVAQREILRAGRCADPIGLHEAQASDRLGQGHWLEGGTSDRVAAEIAESPAASC
jgi:hypothetical protein